MKTRLLSILFAGAGLVLSGCFEDIVKVYDGPPVVEFGQFLQPGSPGNNYLSTVTFSAGQTDATTTIGIRLQLIAPHFPNETWIAFTVPQNRTDEDGEVMAGWTTTAEEGVHYRILNANNRAVFPANSSTTEIRLELLSANLQPGQTRRIILMLTDGDELSPSENHKYFRVDVRKAS